MTQFAPLPLASDIFNINSEREITLDDQIEQLEIPFDESEFHYVLVRSITFARITLAFLALYLKLYVCQMARNGTQLFFRHSSL